jgi:hypothetical protein
MGDRGAQKAKGGFKELLVWQRAKELAVLMEIAFEIGYLDRGLFDELDVASASIGKMLGSLIKIRSEAKAGDRLEGWTHNP